MSGITESAPAKVNLFLRVLAREETGYHQLETLFARLELADELELQRTPSGVTLEVDGADLGPHERNLAYRAARLYLEAAGRAAGLRIRLRKRVPAGAGLGGGSSDAAAVLRGLERLLGWRMGEQRLLALAARLGSDVPFFLSGGPLALAWGRGDRLLPLPPLPRAPVLLALPAEPVVTADAYRELAGDRATLPSPTSPPGRLDLGSLSSWTGVAARAENDFEGPVFRRRPAVAELRRALAATGPLLSLLAGSGSTVFAVYEDERARDAAADALPGGSAVRLIRTATAGADR